MNFWSEGDKRLRGTLISRLKGLFFRVDPQLRGDWVQVRYDPFAERLAADDLWQDDRMRQGLARLR